MDPLRTWELLAVETGAVLRVMSSSPRGLQAEEGQQRAASTLPVGHQLLVVDHVHRLRRGRCQCGVQRRSMRKWCGQFLQP